MLAPRTIQCSARCFANQDGFPQLEGGDLVEDFEEEDDEANPFADRGSSQWLRPLLETYASRGYISVAIDSRCHGERATKLTTYRDALVSAWRNEDTMPFLFDTAWYIIKLADYLTQREDIDPAKIRITGESLGGPYDRILVSGVHASFGAFARYPEFRGAFDYRPL